MFLAGISSYHEEHRVSNDVRFDKTFRNLSVIICCFLEHATKEDRSSFLKELNVMKGLPLHENIISLVGCITKSGNAKNFVSLIRSDQKRLARSFNLYYRYVDNLIVFNKKISYSVSK